MTNKFIVSIANPGESPADNGRTIHALKLANQLKEKGADVVLMFEGKGVTWVDRFHSRTDESHPFVKNYGDAFDAVKPLMRACNMCCKRFESTEAVVAAAIPIDGEGTDHCDLSALALDGYQITHY